MKLSECRIGMIVEIIDKQNLDLCEGHVDQHLIGHIIGLDSNGFEVIPKVMMASGEERIIHHTNIKLYCD